MNQSWNRCCKLPDFEKEAHTDEVILKIEKELNNELLAMTNRRRSDQ